MEKPRRLTTEEIEDLVSVIGSSSEASIRSPAKECSKVANESLKKRLRRDLSRISITPLGLTDLKDQLLRYFIRSKAIPGTPVGFQVSESIGGPTTQMSLNSFKAAGSSAASETGQGIERIQQLIDLTKKPKVTVTKVHFSRKHSYAEAFNSIRKNILEVNVGRLVSNYNISSKQDIEESPHWWYESFEELYGEIPVSDYVLRLEMDIKNMVAFGITMEDIASAIEKEHPRTIKVVFSPLSLGLVDIYAIEDILIERLESGEEEIVNPELIADNVSNIFLNTIIVDNLDKVYIKGIRGATKAFPVSTPLLSILDSETPYPKVEAVWILRFNPDRIFTTGITAEMFSNLLTLLNLSNQVRSPTLILCESLQNPSQVIKEALASGETPKEILDASEYYFVEVQGGKYSELLDLEGVNPLLTVSNNIHEIYETLGIEAARKFYIGELYDLFVMQDLYIDVRHITLMADFISNVGILSAINATGIGRQNIGALAKSTYRRQMEVISKAAVAGEFYKVKSISSQVLLGKPPTTGTGYIDVITKELPPAKETISSSSLAEGIDDLAGVVLGDQHFSLNKEDLEEIFGPGNAPPLTPTSYGTGLKTPTTFFPSAGQLSAGKTTIGPTPKLSPLQQIVPAPVVPNNLVEVEPLISTVTSYTRENQVTVSAVEQPSIRETIPHGERNQDNVIKAERKASTKLRLPSVGSRFTFSTNLPRLQEQRVEKKSTADLLRNL